MKSTARRVSVMASLWSAIFCAAQTPPGEVKKLPPETKEQRDARMDWFRDARFGMFIHWGLYAIPAGEWGGKTTHGEWIRTTGQIPLEEYDKFVGQFNPVKFNAEQWVKMAKDAGMKYIVITSKHHDGFCLFDSKFTDFDVMSTPFKRDILKELSEACRKEGIKMCWYHSIMDWHHPDYLPRRDWEKQRSTAGADFNRYYAQLKNQLKELITNYGPIGILWFDGEWEGTWTHEYGEPLYDYVRSLQPDIIVNNRVDKGRDGMAGMTTGNFAGDYGTPEQEIPATGIPGVDWETCMTMNEHWGYNKHDKNFKSTKELIRMLADIASKGGNFLLNIGPTAEGEFPPESVERLAEIGKWMKVNGEAIYGTSASPFKNLPWGRCTQKPLAGGNTRLYLHVFDWPKDGKLIVPGLLNEPIESHLLVHMQTQSGVRQVNTARNGDALALNVPAEAPDPIDSVVVLDVKGKPDVTEPPVIQALTDIFVDALDVTISSDRERVELRYTVDGTEPAAASPVAQGPIKIAQTTTVSAKAFRDGKPVSGTSKMTFTKATPRTAEKIDGLTPGLKYEYFEGDWDKLPDFDKMKPVKTGVVKDFEFSPRTSEERFGFRYRGYISVPRDGAYVFSTLSDDGSRLYIGDKLVVDNDGLHSLGEKTGVIALAAGAHPITVTFFEKTGGNDLEVRWAGPGLEKKQVPAAALMQK